MSPPGPANMSFLTNGPVTAIQCSQLIFTLGLVEEFLQRIRSTRNAIDSIPLILILILIILLTANR
jgi:hypothetical protein